MRTWWKVLIGMVVALPMLAYVAGSLMASSAVSPPRPDPVVISDAPPMSTDPTPTLRPDPSRPPGSDDDDDDPGDDRDDRDDGDGGSTPKGNVDDNGVEVVNPDPTGVDDDDDGNDDDDDDRGGGGDDGDDDSRDGGDD